MESLCRILLIRWVSYVSLNVEVYHHFDWRKYPRTPRKFLDALGSPGSPIGAERGSDLEAGILQCNGGK